MNKEVSSNTNEIVLKVGGITNPGSLKTAIIGHLTAGKLVQATCIGVAANYIVTKAIIMVRAHLQMVGKEMNFEPYFMDVTIEDKNGINDGAKKTAIRWVMTLK